MTLQQLFDNCDRGSYFSRTRQEVINKINAAARYVYNWVIKESRGYFLKWDTSQQITPLVNEIQLAQDVKQIIRVREYDPESGRWRIVHSTDFLEAGRAVEQFAPLVYFTSTDSPFKFYGPYEKNDGRYYLQITPPTERNRTIEVVYNARYVEIEDPSDYMMIPEDALHIVEDIAVAKLRNLNDDSSGGSIYTQANMELAIWLQTIRDMQNQDPPRQEAYLL